MSCVADLADELDPGPVEQRLDVVSIVLPVGPHIGIVQVIERQSRADLQRDPGSTRDLDGAVEPLLGCDAPEPCQVGAATRVEVEAVGVDRVIDRPRPASLRERGTLVVRDRDHRHRGKAGIEAREVLEIQPPVQRRDRRRRDE